jgi:o-succinylbenzoate synthase
MFNAALTRLVFRFITPGKTSRGILYDKPSWFLSITNRSTGIRGLGEFSVIPGLNPEYNNKYLNKLLHLVWEINTREPPSLNNYNQFPSIRFGLETALKDMETGGKGLLFPSGFTAGEKGIPVNGLIWMGSIQEMERQISTKISAGFTCLKLKIGALDFSSEVELIKTLRKQYNPQQLEIRVDVNGAFLPGEALEKLTILGDFGIHSAEQPIKPGQWKAMAGLSISSPVPVALDEELIGIDPDQDGERMLAEINPRYIILKPSLLGGFEKCAQWIALAEKMGTGWWITSALESNIGLNAIAQWTYTLRSKMVQGLGTGQVFRNNFSSPLSVKGQHLHYDPLAEWNIGNILN